MKYFSIKRLILSIILLVIAYVVMFLMFYYDKLPDNSVVYGFLFAPQGLLSDFLYKTFGTGSMPGSGAPMIIFFAVSVGYYYFLLSVATWLVYIYKSQSKISAK